MREALRLGAGGMLFAIVGVKRGFPFPGPKSRANISMEMLEGRRYA